MKTYCVTNPFQKSPEVLRLQKALHTDGFYNGPLDGIFGGATGNSCAAAKYNFGYPDDQINHCGGQALLNYLTGAKELPDDYKERRKARQGTIDAHHSIRDKLVSYMKWAAANEPQIHYAETRPMEMLHNPQHLPWTSDCSEFVTTLYCWSGAPDPNGQNYNGYGYTGTLLDHGVSIALYNSQPGDVVIWGHWPGHHTAMIYSVANRTDPLICSHGWEGGPGIYPMSVETAAQQKYGAGTYTVKRYL